LTIPHSFRAIRPHEPSRSLAVRVKRGNSTVTIDKASRRKNGRIYREFKLAYYDAIGKRQCA
jgi:hypothetical protein